MHHTRVQTTTLLIAAVAAALTVAAPLPQRLSVSTVAAAPDVPATQDRPDVAAPRAGDPISAAEMRDLQTVAEQSGTPLGEVIERYAWNDSFALAVDQLREAAPEHFAGAAIVDAHHAWIAFKGAQPPVMRTLAATFERISGDVVVAIRADVGFSEREVDAAVAAAHFAVLTSAGVGDATTSFDFDTRQIIATVTPSMTSVILDAGALKDVASRAVHEVVADGELSRVAITVRVAGPATR
ncbi:MAG TPA: hypothetical protein VLC50_07355 [Actinomycetes bacterium]|nr:hypothetical protein [Actinomycetes bacterium]